MVKFSAEISEDDSETTYEDSLHYLSLLHPDRSRLKLDDFIQEYGIRESEVHRGFEDSLDLLKVLIASTYRIKKIENFRKKYQNLFSNIIIEDWWFAKSFQLDHSELEESRCKSILKCMNP